MKKVIGLIKSIFWTLLFLVNCILYAIVEIFYLIARFINATTCLLSRLAIPVFLIGSIFLTANDHFPDEGLHMILSFFQTGLWKSAEAIFGYSVGIVIGVAVKFILIAIRNLFTDDTLYFCSIRRDNQVCRLKRCIDRIKDGVMKLRYGSKDNMIRSEMNNFRQKEHFTE